MPTSPRLTSAVPQDRPRLLVAYDGGAAGPAELLPGLSRLGDVVLVLPDRPGPRRLQPLLTSLAEVLVVDPDPDRALPALRRARPSAVLTFGEELLATAAAWADGLGLPHVSPEAVGRITAKHRQRETLRQAGVDAVRSIRITGPSELSTALWHTGLPAVIKPVTGAASRNTYLVEDTDAAAGLVTRLLSGPEPELLVEEYLADSDRSPFGAFVSVESVVHQGRPELVAVTGKFPMLPPFRELGHFWPAVLRPGEEAEVTQLAHAAIRALGIGTGVIHTEIKLTPSGPRILEVNARMGGQINLLAEAATGFGLVHAAGLLALGRPVPRPTQKPGQVTFLHNVPAPVQACRLEGIEGGPAVRALPGVRSYRSGSRPGTRLPGGPQTQWLDTIIGHTPDHASMLQTLEEVLNRLSYTFAGDHGLFTLSAHELETPGPPGLWVCDVPPAGGHQDPWSLATGEVRP